MIVDFELPVVIRSRIGRSAAELTVMGTIPYRGEIQEFERRSAPHAFAFTQFRSDGQVSGFETVEYRSAGNALFAATGWNAPAQGETVFSSLERAAARHPFLSSILGEMDDIVRGVETGKRRPAQSLAPNSLVRFVVDRAAVHAFEPLVTLDLPQAAGASIAARVDAFERHLEEFAVIDGALYRREPEPLIRLFPNGPWLSAEIVRRGHAERKPMYNPPPRSVGWFRIDDRGSMIETAELLSDRLGIREPLQDSTDRIEILDPSPLKTRPEAFAVRDVAAAIRHNFQLRMARDGDGEDKGAALARWLSKGAGEKVRFFKALAEGARGGAWDEELPESVEAAFLSIVEDRTASYEEFFAGTRLRLFAEVVARRWLERPVSIGFGP
jgi:hypothetical protein